MEHEVMGQSSSPYPSQHAHTHSHGHTLAHPHGHNHSHSHGHNHQYASLNRNTNTSTLLGASCTGATSTAVSGLGLALTPPPPDQQWPPPLNIHEHIQRCTCTCDHMGYGNYLDYQGTNLIELPDVSRVSPIGGGFSTVVSLPPNHGQNGSAVRINGTTVIEADSLSSGSKEDLATGGPGTGTGPGAEGKGVELKMRHWCLVCCVVLFAAAIGVGVGVPLAIYEDFIPSPHQRLQTVQQILREVPLIDGHNDLPWNIRKFVHNQIQDFNFSSDLRKVEPWSRSTWSHTDLPRLQQGMVGCQLWSAYIPCGAQHLDAVQLTLEQIDVIRRLTEKYSTALEWVTTPRGIESAHRRGKIASMVGVEGGHSLGNSIAVLRMFYNLGARYLTLTHSCNTPWADCSSADDPGSKTKSSGLKEFGKSVIKEMNRLGMIIDLSHVSVQTMRDSLEVTQAPVIFSHSSAHSLCNSSRNVPDDILHLLSSNGGLVMVNFYSYFITCNESASINDVIDHINHIRNVAGVDHVGIGAGFDGINFTPRGLEDVSKYPNLFTKLLEDARWSVEDLKKLAGLNFLRVFRQVELVRDKWQMAAVEPVEALIKSQLLEGHTQCVYMGS